MTCYNLKLMFSYHYTVIMTKKPSHNKQCSLSMFCYLLIVFNALSTTNNIPVTFIVLG